MSCATSKRFVPPKRRLASGLTHLCQVNSIGSGVLEDYLQTSRRILVGRKRGHDAKTPVWKLLPQLAGGMRQRREGQTHNGWGVSRLCFLIVTFTCQLTLVRGFTLSDLLDKPRRGDRRYPCPLPPPPDTGLNFYRAKGSAFLLLVGLHRIPSTRALALPTRQF